MPVFPKRVQPVAHNDRDRDQNAKQAYKTYYDNRHGARILPMLKPNDTVLTKTDDDKKCRGQEQVLGPADFSGRSNLIDYPQGVIRRNRKHLQKIPRLPDVLPEPEVDLPEDNDSSGQDIPASSSPPSQVHPIPISECRNMGALSSVHQDM